MFLRGWIGQFSGALNYFSPSGVHDFLVINSLRKNFFHRKIKIMMIERKL